MDGWLQRGRWTCLLESVLMMSSSSPDTAQGSSHVAEVPAEIDFETFLQGTPSEICARLREYLCSPAFERPLDPTMAEYRQQTLDWCYTLARSGFAKLGLPEDMGGHPLGFFLLCESLALFDTSLMVKFGVHAGLVQATIARLGTERHRSWLALTPSFERVGCFAMTETAHGSDVRGLETVVRYEQNSQEFVVDTPHRGARKDYIGSAALHGHFAVVFAQLESAGVRRGIHAFLVPLREQDGQLRPGVQIEDCGPKAGLNGVDNGRISFFGVRIPRENLLNRFSDIDANGQYQTTIEHEGARFFTLLGNLLAGRLMVCAATWSGARACLTIAIRYGARRRQFGESETVLLDYPSYQKRLMPRVAQAYATKMALDGVRDEYLKVLAEERPVGRGLETRIAALKTYCSWTASEAVQVCRECCGGAGYLAENRLGLVRADLDVFTTFEGDNTVLGLLVARNLLAEHKDESKVSSVSTAERLMPGRWARAPKVLTHAKSVAAVRTAEFQMTAFRVRRERLTASLAQRMERLMKGGASSGEAFILCQNHALALAWAYATECVFEAFESLVSEREIFAPLRDLFALWTLETEAAYFLEKKLLSGGQIKVLRQVVSELCLELRDCAEELVNYFDIPDRLLGAPNLLEPLG